MYIYYKINNKDIYKILSGMILNINEQIVYTKKVKPNKDEILVRIHLQDNERFCLIKIKENQYLLNRVFNLENNSIKFIIKEKSQLEQIKKGIDFIKEIKINTNMLNKYYILDNEYHYSDNVFIDRLPCVEKNNCLYKRKIDILKGFIYGSFRDKQKLNKYLLNEEAIIYNEYIAICRVIEELNHKSVNDKQILFNLKNLKKRMNNEIEKNLQNKNYKNILIKEVTHNKIYLNNKYFNLSDFDFKLYEYILNFFIFKLIEVNNEKEKLKLIINNLEKKNFNFEIKKEILLIKQRVVDEDFTVNVKDIKNIVLRNFFAVAIKYDNIKELIMYLNEKKIDGKFLAFSILGILKGYTNINGSLMGIENYNSKIIKDNIKFIEYNVSNLSYNRNIYRLKLTYLLSILFKYRDLLNFENKYYKVNYKNNDLSIILKRDQSIMNISYNKRSNNIAKNIKYFDNREIQLKKLNKNYNICKEFYFNYNFIIKNKKKTLDYRYEYIFGNILEEIYGEVIKNENNKK